ncbi:MAG: tautomerase family protein [Hoeflea sp.]|uniref:tautomerase family protein n=1 Tax=Hoeflea sp. TaxID=1940281 RepID=UPI002730B1CA|nr:tautomerase family protein [Hoeflea sp.]MDP2118934.1 tautomerase family protein [Hoeflea sp.]MDP3527652.1 tautomerase family protein [Hoeflea sp.]MDZ7601418.1 tautomerase family protein [Hoeflea sp.]
MPLVTFHVPQTLPPERVDALCDAVQEALVATANVPADDRFQVVCRHERSGLRIDRGFLGITRGPEAVIVEITFRMGRTLDQKQALFSAIARLAHAKARLRPDDVMVVLTENTSLDWSFGGGVAHYAQTPVPV